MAKITRAGAQDMTGKSNLESEAADSVVDEVRDPSDPDVSSRPSGGPRRERTPDALDASDRRRPGPRISKTVLNFIVDAALVSLVVLLLFSTAVLRFVFPAPSTSGGWTLWGYGYDAWSNLQFVLVAIMGLAILLHVMLHWSWVCGVVLTKLLKRSGARQNLDDGQQTLWGVGMLIVVVNILGLLVGLAYLTIERPAP